MALRRLTARFVVFGLALAAMLVQTRAEVRPQYFVSYSSATFTPEHAVVVHATTGFETSGRARIYRVSETQMLAVLGRRRQLSASDFASQRPVAEVATTAVSGERYTVNKADFGRLRPGPYAVVWRLLDAERPSTPQFVNVSTIGLTALAVSGGANAVAAFDLRTFDLRRDVKLTALRTDGDSSLTIGADGLARCRCEMGYILGQLPDGSLAVTEPSNTSTSRAGEVAFVHVDRPLYRGGQVVHYRAIVRSGEPGDYAIPTGSRGVQMRDGTGTVTRQSAVLDRYGTLHGEFRLPDTPASSYPFVTLSVTRGDDQEEIGSTGFEVMEYRRPEYVVEAKPQADHFIGGQAARIGASARYLFGRPAAGLAIHYRSSVSPDRFFNAYRAVPSVYAVADEAPPPSVYAAVQGDAKTGADGSADIVIPTKPVETEELESVEVDARDASGHTVTARTQVRITPASFYVRLDPQSYFSRVNEAIALRLETRDYSERPRPNEAVSLTVTGLDYDPGVRKTIRTEYPQYARSVNTGPSAGVGTSFTPDHPGLYELTATASDEAGRRTKTIRRLWVTPPYGWNGFAPPGAAMTAEKKTFAPGERPRLLITTERAGVDVIVSVAWGSHNEPHVVHLPSTVSTITVDPPRGMPVFAVRAIVPTENGIRTLSAAINVAPAPHHLEVVIRPDRERYEPGSTANVEVEVRTADGRPARSVLALGVVDEAIYALSFARSPDLGFATFYRSQRWWSYPRESWSSLNVPAQIYLDYRPLLSIARITSRPNEFSPGITADTYSINKPSFENLRSDFRETAYWTPAVETDERGHARVSFTWPDSLTTFRSNAVAVTAATDIGDGQASSLVTKDFLVRLELPRYLRRGDSARAVGIAQGRPEERGAQLQLSAPAFGAADIGTSVPFAAFATGSARWTLQGGALGTWPVRLAGTSGALRDGMELPLPVQSAGTPLHERAAGTLASRPSLPLLATPGTEAGDLRIDLAPSALTRLAQGLRQLQVYPYYCTEQTLSAILPIAFLDRAKARFGFAVGGPAAVEVVRRGMERLRDLQRGNGAWGWWQYDEDNPVLTAYVVYGTAELERAGYESTFDLSRAHRYLVEHLKGADAFYFTKWGGAEGDAQYNVRALMLFALANLDGARFDRALFPDVDRQADKLNSYALAVLGLAHHFAGDDDGARTMLRKLAGRAKGDASYTYWEGATWSYAWEDDPVETTAYALRLYSALDRTAPAVEKIVNWLRLQSRGSWWYTTKDTAAALSALAEAIDPEEVTPHESVRVTLDGETLKTFRFDSAYQRPEDTSLLIPAARLESGGTIRFEREGTGAVYWSSDWTRYSRSGAALKELSPEAARALHADLDPTFSIVRHYRPERGWPIRIGDLVSVTLDVRVNHARQFVAIEDPFPAGLEYQPLLHEAGMNWSGIAFLDDKAVFFTTQTWAGEHLRLSYRLRAMTAGAFNAPAPTAYAMYGPPVTAVGSAERVAIRDD